jgi:hypothetical protein
MISSFLLYFLNPPSDKFDVANDRGSLGMLPGAARLP